jgi:predicted porin
MKKSLLAVAVAAALPTFAQAQSSVTLYGILDAAVEFSNSDANALATTASTGALVPSPDSVIRLNSGTQSGSRFGVRGTESLGGGLSAIFTIEHRLAVDTGNTAGGGFAAGNGTFWNGQAFVGLAGRWGQLTAGRQYTPIFWAMLPADFAGYGFYNNWAGFSGNGFSVVTPQGPIRIDNSLAYKSPTMGGLTVYAMYAFGEQVTKATTGTGANTAGGKSGDVMGIAAGWQMGGLYLTAGYHSIDTNVAGGIETVLAASATYSFANFGLSLGYTQQDFIGGGEVNVILGSGFLNLGPGRLIANIAMIDPNFTGLRNDTALQWGLAYSMPLSKRTNAYVALGMNDLSGLQSSTATTLIDGAMRATVGVRHLF